MLLKWVTKNKYKLMVFIIGLYLVTDIALHKGMARILLQNNFPERKIENNLPQNKNTLINTGKKWVKAVDTKELMDKLPANINGFECDVYFDLEKNIFDVHHDIDNSIGLDLVTLLEAYRQKKMQSGIWLDLKNLDDSNYKVAVDVLVGLRNEFGLKDKILVESNRADLLTAFSDKDFYTSYYTPMFNPYQMEDEEIKHWVDSLSLVIRHSNVSALSGYYFQYPFLHRYFPQYPVLTWAANDRLSLTGWLFKRKIARSTEIFIVLYPW